jgi:hypothetical protein
MKYYLMKTNTIIVIKAIRVWLKDCFNLTNTIIETIVKIKINLSYLL